jgi:F420-non-reducing hydrogenase large subunit
VDPAGTFSVLVCQMQFLEEIIMKRITIDPITRLEGHGKIEIFMNEEGNVSNVYFQVPELRGFEKFVEGRPVEELPSIVAKFVEFVQAVTTWLQVKRWMLYLA